MIGSMEDLLKQGLRAAGAVDYLTKPIDVIRFLAVVDGRLEAKANHGN